MTSAAFVRHIGKTGRPLGVGDIFRKVVETLGFVDASTRRANKLTAGRLALATEAAAVRQLADQNRHWSPGFAADLYAAADRHERDDLA